MARVCRPAPQVLHAMPSPVLLARQPHATPSPVLPARQPRPQVVARVDQVNTTDLLAWRAAAADFIMNDDFDFDIKASLKGQPLLPLSEVMKLMKDQSGGKRTIQALGDKIILSKMMENLNVPQMPVIFSTYRRVDKAEVEQLVQRLESEGEKDPTAFDIVIKPTHLSNGSGALILSQDKWKKGEYSSQKLISHMEEYLAKKAADSESEALKSLVPGFIVQPRYRSSVGFSFPLEMRVITLFGKARMGIWWWGRHKDPKGQRTTWLVRKQKVHGKLSKDDTWEVVHEHVGTNQGFDVALELFKKTMPAMASAAEGIASAVGAPFLRSDFFIGSVEWGVRLNEVAYGSGVDYKQRPAGASKPVDDAPAIAQILQEGLRLCRRQPSSHFLSKLGASDEPYDSPSRKNSAGEPVEPGMHVEAVSSRENRTRLESDAVKEMLGAARSSCAIDVPSSGCETPRSHHRTGASVRAQLPARHTQYVRYPPMSAPQAVRYTIPVVTRSVRHSTPPAVAARPPPQVVYSPAPSVRAVTPVAFSVPMSTSVKTLPYPGSQTQPVQTRGIWAL
eukprot:TRINITY_DN40057_c0_g1_i1.p1 TRINITY_DN40057_c0_g1~~TRINITY_DN40057_c0_g1_i1.p1  ORF type:complete len:562 (+),score=95.07 TRINITY_DN40057_c0_g1_i1:39-1724(+)